jgi:perosamine synthetase
VRIEPFPPRSLRTVDERDAAVRLFDTAIAEGRAIGYAGPEEQAFCEEFAATLGGGHADGVSSGTAALIGALGLEPHSHVVLGAITTPAA